MDEEIIKTAIEFAKRNKVKIARERTDPKIFVPDAKPVSVFMAGSPGAGKTEYSKGLIKTLEKDADHQVLRIDADEIRALMPGYTGKNSSLFHGAVSLVVEKMHDMALHQNQTFVLDGTMSKYEKAVDNIRRSLKKGRVVIIFYIYQQPELAWKFTVAREEAEGRNIPKDSFIDQFLNAQLTVKRIRKEFGSEVALYLVKKDYLQNSSDPIKVESNATIDDHLDMGYTKERLKEML